ncbi:MAG: isocitrate/isopropylmalate family dehydrogenase [Mariprofundaceae bacterium]|nr:isocitrate/isopropylmalate family dehydrogenase [Mariprofundaceae bacterium]
MTLDNTNVPEPEQNITSDTHGHLHVPQQPIIPFMQGKGSSATLWTATQTVLDAAVNHAYAGERKIDWLDLFAGEQETPEDTEIDDNFFPERTLAALLTYQVSMQNFFNSHDAAYHTTSQQESGFNITLRTAQYFADMPSPVTHPEHVDVVMFKDNAASSTTGKTESLLRAALQYALKNKRKSVTLIHSGNVDAAYAFAKAEFAAVALEDGEGYVLPDGLRIQSCHIATAFQQLFNHASDFDVVVTLGAESAYLSEMMVAQVGGIAAIAHINPDSAHVVFGSADAATQALNNPISLMLSGAMMLRHLAWTEASLLVLRGIEGAIAAKTVTSELACVMEGAVQLSTAEFGSAVVEHMTDMLEQDEESDQYDALADKFHEFFDAGAEKTADFAHIALEKARTQLTIAGRFTEEKGHKLKKFIENDFAHVAQDMKVGAKEKLNPSRLGTGILASMSKLLHVTGVALSKVADKADGALACKSGEITSAGSLQCNACAYAMNFKKTGRIPPCPKCHKTEFTKGY